MYNFINMPFKKGGEALVDLLYKGVNKPKRGWHLKRVFYISFWVSPFWGTASKTRIYNVKEIWTQK
ncbi:hypothetical protein ADA01nite_10480 [Aneurinibacillus danicus]|uniref:Uncharacterized protein n=1 Tax=Aneurinibacillus danicus TaxID=267746 RepID=A0A511V6Q3_9BACL|nr:hypothetical protein ADA01nite_10480 [Aneurinibacillus danicus]